MEEGRENKQREGVCVSMCVYVYVLGLFADTHQIKQINSIHNKEWSESCVLHHSCTPQSHSASPCIT